VIVTESIKGINIVIGSDTTALSKALGDVNKKSRDIQSELKLVEKLLKMDPSNTELLAQKQKLLADALKNTKEKLDGLKKAQEQVNAQFKKGEINEGQYRAFQREIIKAEGELKKLEAQGEKTNKALSKEDAVNNLKNIGKVAGAAALAVGAMFAGMAKKAVENADELQKLSDVTGLSAERLQELQYAGAQLGVEIDTITGAQAKLTKAMFAAKDGTGSQAEAFAALGLSVVDANGNLRDVKDVMGEAFTALSKVTNETERDALAMQIFGKSAMALNPVIKAGGDGLKKLTDEARANGAVMSNEAVAGLDAFGDTIESLKTSVLGSFGEKFAQMLPDIQAFLEMLKGLPKWIQDNSDLLVVLAIGFGTLTTALITYNISAITAAVSSGILATAAGILGSVLAFITAPVTLVILAIGALIAIGYLLIKNWDTVKVSAQQLGAFITNVWNSLVASVKAIWDGIKNAVVGAWDWMYAHNYYFQKIVDTVTTCWNFIKGISEIVWNAISSFLSGLWDGIASRARSAWDTIAGVVESVTSYIGGVFDDTLGKACDWGGNLLGQFIEGVKARIADLKEILNEVGQAISGFLGFHSPTKLGPGSDADKWAPNLIKMFTRGIESGIPALQDTMGRLASMLEVKPIDISGRLSVGGAIGVNITGEGSQYLKVDSIARAVEQNIVNNLSQDSRRYAPIPRTIPFANS
jgi:phage-related minor tail protein